MYYNIRNLENKCQTNVRFDLKICIVIIILFVEIANI